MKARPAASGSDRGASTGTGSTATATVGTGTVGPDGLTTDGAPAFTPGRRADRLAERAEARGGLLYCLKVFLSVRVALALVALMAVALLPDLSNLSPAARQALPPIPGPVSVPGWPAHVVTPGWHNLFTSWERFDGLWYLRIASQGYRNGDGSAAFFPLYPLLIRGLSFLLGGHPYAASLVVSNLAFLGALFVLHALTRRELGEDLARRAVLYAAVFPTAFFFLAPYSESLFFLLALLALWWARKAKWALAGLAGALAALTRNVGALLLLPLAVEAVHEAFAARPRRIPIRGLLWSAAPLAGTGAFLAFCHHLSGDWLAPMHQQAVWERHLTDPALTLIHGTQAAIRYVGIYPGGYHFLDWLIAVPVLAAAIYATVKLRPAYGIYVWTGILVPLAYVFDGRPLMSFPRFAVVIFPLYWAFALWTRRRPLRHEILVAASSVLLGFMTVLFVAWYYVF